MNKSQKMMLGIAIGDAFGAGYEFSKDLQFDRSSLFGYRQHPKAEFKHVAGRYTDDTQMSLGVAELLISDAGFNRENLAENFVNCYKRDPVVGYAGHFQQFLDSISNGEEFLARIRPQSERNGAAMRSVPLGLVKDLDTLVGYATTNARLTHDTPKGIASSIAVGVMSFFNFHFNRHPYIDELTAPIRSVDMETAEYLKAVSEMEGLDKYLLLGPEDYKKGVPCDGMRTAGAVLYVLSNFKDPNDVLFESVNLRGDTDSVASISLGINLMNQSVSALPNQLYDELTNNSFGRDYLLKLGNQLHQKFG